MSDPERRQRVETLSMARTMVELIEKHELPIAENKAEMCREHGWSVLEGIYTELSERLKHQRDQLRVIIDREIDQLASR